MGWLDRNNSPAPVPPQATQADKYTVANIERLLDEIGPMRLSIADVDTKLFVTTIAWSTTGYMNRKSNGKSPPGGLVAELQEQLSMIKNVLVKYIDIQNQPDTYTNHGDVTELLEQGKVSLRVFAEKLTNTSSSSTQPDVTGYTVDTRILTTHFN